MDGAHLNAGVFGGALQGVVHQVQEHVPDPPPVRDHRTQLRGEPAMHPMRPGGQLGQDLVHDLAHREGPHLDGASATFQVARVQQVADQSHQPVGLLLGRGQELGAGRLVGL